MIEASWFHERSSYLGSYVSLLFVVPQNGILQRFVTFFILFKFHRRAKNSKMVAAAILRKFFLGQSFNNLE